LWIFAVITSKAARRDGDEMSTWQRVVLLFLAIVLSLRSTREHWELWLTIAFVFFAIRGLFLFRSNGQFPMAVVVDMGLTIACATGLIIIWALLSKFLTVPPISP
jgi:hypothetical protein